MPRCVDLLESHPRLAGLLAAHQEAVVLGDLETARSAFHAFAALLHAHSRSEDEILLPAFAAAGLESNGCTVSLLEKEHAKLRRLCAEAQNRIDADGVELDAATRVAWIKALHMLGEVLEHHDERERAAFNPAFDAGLPAMQAAELAARASAREAELEAQYLRD
ncbi:MAG: hemerythrin domain-containing protein [Planctomycetota bacterium]